MSLKKLAPCISCHAWNADGSSKFIPCLLVPPFYPIDTAEFLETDNDENISNVQFLFLYSPFLKIL